ncbi:Hypothetical protein NTJ_04352 [Nesidiocoris tenuis]|uniref:ribonuclease H n=1 Tax=Nesidiocoris tenuis TaxID=355587 RepID=A0ABN7AK37_9HEMI|nr:Hypothetical protein NTJ_04352 [Nesidiocoris tenuis]
MNEKIPTIPNIQSLPKITQKQLVTEFMTEKLGDNYETIYTDGSKLQEGETAAAFYCMEHKLGVGSKLSNAHSVLSAELIAMNEALNHVKHYHNNDKTTIIFSDSKSNLQKITNLKIGDNPDFVTQQLIHSIQFCRQNLYKTIKFQWIPGHIDLKGHDAADRLAGLTARHGRQTTRSELDHPDAKQIIQKRADNLNKAAIERMTESHGK